MPISNIIRGAGRGLRSLGQVVQSASHKLDEMVAPPPPQVAQPQPSEGAPAPQRGFTLPDLGPGPMETAPEFQGDAGKVKYAEALRDYQHKQDIHQAYSDLEKIYTDAHPGRDFEKEYRDQVAMLQQHEQERPRENALSTGLNTLADFNPAVRQSGRSLAGEYKQGVGEAQAASDKGFSQRMMLRQKATEAAATDAEAQGNWKKALAEREKLALMQADEDSLKHSREMEKVGAQQAGATQRANIKADAMQRTATIRANVIASTHGLSGGFLAAFQKEAAKAVAKFLGPQDLTKDYTPADVDSITTYLEHLAEMFHDQQFNTEDGGDNHLKTSPSKRGQPKPKEKF
jgi:hypothetical protein